jgi:small subunit ribosomal protein S27Ae
MAKGKSKRKISDIFAVEGGAISRQAKSCQKCGPGVFLAEHYDRLHCGKCGYTQFKKKDGTVTTKAGKKAPAGGHRQPRQRSGGAPRLQK